MWNLAGEHFYDSRQLVDWYHATDHLATAAGLVKGEGTPATRQWFKEHETVLFQGHAERIAERLRQAGRENPADREHLLTEAGYFQNNHRRRNYLDTREDGFPIGSGMVESGCKQFRARFSGPGMRWSRAGIRLLPVRTAIMSRRFDPLWQAAYQPPPRN